MPSHRRILQFASDLGKGLSLAPHCRRVCLHGSYLGSEPFSNVLFNSSDFPVIKWRLFSSPMF